MRKWFEQTVSNMLLEDLFDVKNIDEDGKKFENISRISALSQTYNLELTLDVNTEIYPIKVRPSIFTVVQT